MAVTLYDRLSVLDQSFLLYESPTNHMHVAGVATYEAADLRTKDGGIDIDRIRAYVDSRLHLIPRYRQVLSQTPVEGHPVWVDDQHFNIHYHVRHTSLPRPGDERQLKRLSARIMSQQLDRSKPLWEMWVVEGLEGGDRFGLITKVHHCMIDGMSSVDLLAVLLAPTPSDRIEEAPRWVPRPVPTTWQMLRTETTRRFISPFDVARGFGQVLEQVRDPRSDLRVTWRAARGVLRSNLRSVSDTPINKPIGPHRRFDWLPMSVADVKDVKKRIGGSLNDIVLTTVSGAVQRYFEGRRVNVDFLNFRVMAPVSVRSAEEKGTLGNRVSAWIVDLPLNERDPLKRLQAIGESTARLKETKGALGAEMLTRVAEWSPSTLLSLGSRMMMRALPFNLVVTNVPGPQVPLYLMRSQMIDNYPMVPLTDYLGLGVALFSYAGTLCWGFNADWDLLPDLHDFVGATEASFQELRRIAEPIEVRGEAKDGATADKKPGGRAARANGSPALA
jgi:WS/DGAT/MGAT family acyltransferase